MKPNWKVLNLTYNFIFISNMNIEIRAVYSDVSVWINSGKKNPQEVKQGKFNINNYLSMVTE